MKNYLILGIFLASFAIPAAPAHADDHEWDNGGGNNETAVVDEGSDGHTGDEK